MNTATTKPSPKAPAAPRFACQECGHKFRTIAAAERASSVGCPKCGGVDIDEAVSK